MGLVESGFLLSKNPLTLPLRSIFSASDHIIYYFFKVRNFQMSILCYLSHSYPIPFPILGDFFSSFLFTFFLWRVILFLPTNPRSWKLYVVYYSIGKMWVSLVKLKNSWKLECQCIIFFGQKVVNKLVHLKHIWVPISILLQYYSLLDFLAIEYWIW